MTFQQWQRCALLLSLVLMVGEGLFVSAFTAGGVSPTGQTGRRRQIIGNNNNCVAGRRSIGNRFPSPVDIIPKLSMIPVDGDGPGVLTYMHLSSTTTVVAATDEWRQYVPLIVISLVLVDIVLGSPLANLALSPMRRAAAKAEEQQGGRGGDEGGANAAARAGNFGLGKAINSKLGSGGDVLKNPKERVDTATIAQNTLDKARGTLELMDYLENNKSNEQLYEEARKKMDKQFEELDSKNTN
jgi:hypothetical protein